MDRRIPHKAAWLGLAVGIGMLTGCVEKRFVITTEPQGAIVFDEKNMPMSGATPADRQFTYYGKYRFTLVHDGYQTMVVEEHVKAPWYEFILLDFVSENVLPWTIRDVRRFHYVLQPAQLIPPEEILNRADQLQERGRAIGTPRAPAEPAPVQGPPPRPVMPPAPM